MARYFRFLLGSAVVMLCLFGCLTGSQKECPTHDWEEIVKKDTLIVLMENSASTYYWFQGVEMGFDFELIKKFAIDHHLHLQVKVMDDVDSMFHFLATGKADLIASNLTYTANRDSMVDFSDPLYATRQVLVQRAFDVKKQKEKYPIIEDTLGLVGTMISVHGYSVFYDRLKELERNMDTVLSIHIAPGTYSTDDLVRLVSEGKLQATITDESLMGILSEDYPNIDYHLDMSEPQPICWAFRNHSPKFKEVVDAWLQKETTKLKINQLRKKYFKGNTTSIIHSHTSMTLPRIKGGVLSPFDAIYREESKILEWDWRLLAALSYQESRFDSTAVSRHGAFGLMQLMPESAINFGCDTADCVKGNIHAAALLLQDLDRQLKRKVRNKEERIKFVLAAYNSGLGHVLDAMQIARKLNQPDTIWYQHVENTLLLKSQREFYTMEGVKNGYCRCHETYHFVYRVLGYYEHFKKQSAR